MDRRTITEHAQVGQRKSEQVSQLRPIVIIKWDSDSGCRYWEAKLAEGHVPSESKIENFIRTKYDSKRWAMDGPIPDPATLDAGGDDDMVRFNCLE